MAAQDLIIFEPNFSEETDVLIAFGKALKLKFKFAESEDFEVKDEIKIPEWHKAIVAERLEDYQKNPQTNLNFDVTIKNIREN